MKKLILILMFLVMVTPSVMAEGRFVQGVVDGQTLKLLNGERVRLNGIVIPDEFSQKASELIRSLVSGSVVALEYDAERTDENGDLLAYVWFRYEPRVQNDQILFPDYFDVHYVVDNEGDGDFFVLLNTTVVKAGYGTPSEADPNGKYANLINKLYEERPIKTAKRESEIHAKADLN